MELTEEVMEFQPGSICNVAKDYVDIRCGVGALRITELQLEGKKRMNAHDFLLGVKLQAGVFLG